MSAIIMFVKNMIPCMLIAIPIYLIVRVIIIKTKKIKMNLYREIALFAFVIFCAGLASLTVIPKFEFGVSGFNVVENGVHGTNLIPFLVFVETFNEVFINGNINYFLINFVGNIVMFIPFGIFIPFLWKTSGKRTVFIGFCVSLFIETCQLFLTRGTDIDDLMLNTVGVFIGVVIYEIMFKHFKGLILKYK